MSPADRYEPELNGDEALAAEYVLGVLPADERQATAARIAAEPAFARLVETWEARLAPMAVAYGEVAPDPALHDALQKRLFGQIEVPSLSHALDLWRSLALWRTVSAGAIAALAVALVLPALAPRGGQDGMLMTSMSSQGSDVSYLAMYDGASREIGLSHLAGQRAEGRDFELWVIEGQNAPRSLGVIPAGENMRMPVSPELSRLIGAGATFAISIEPEGGSPTGEPTGPVVARGSLREI